MYAFSDTYGRKRPALSEMPTLTLKSSLKSLRVIKINK